MYREDVVSLLLLSFKGHWDCNFKIRDFFQKINQCNMFKKAYVLSDLGVIIV